MEYIAPPLLPFVCLIECLIEFESKMFGAYVAVPDIFAQLQTVWTVENSRDEEDDMRMYVEEKQTQGR